MRAPSRPRLKIARGSKLALTRAPSARNARLLRLEHIDGAAHLIDGAQQRGVAAKGFSRFAQQRAWASVAGGSAAQIRPPPQS